MAPAETPPRLAVAEIFITPLGTGEATIREYILSQEKTPLIRQVVA